MSRTRRLQLVFLLVLAVAVAQVVWWLVDQTGFVSDLEQAETARIERDRAVAQRLLDEGVPWVELSDEFEELELAADTAGPDPEGATSQTVVVSQEALARRHAERSSHLNQYRWEGAFFLLVLIAAMAVLFRVIRREEGLRRRQENFLAAASHELKSPLSSMLLATETMVARPLDDERRGQLLQRNLRDLRRLEEMVHKLLDSAQLESDRKVLVATRLPLKPLVEEVVSEGLRDGAVDPVSVAVEIPEALEIDADPVAAKTVVRNLFENALHATEKATNATIRLEARESDALVELSVCDSGRGFDPEDARRLFDKFYRPGTEMVREHRGTGLGLYLVKRFMELEGGSARASSRGPGQGAEFVVAWPAR